MSCACEILELVTGSLKNDLVTGSTLVLCKTTNSSSSFHASSFRIFSPFFAKQLFSFLSFSFPFLRPLSFVITFLKFHQHLVTKESNTSRLLDFHEDTKESCSHNTCSRILFYLDVGGKRIRCPGATSARFLVTHRPPKAVSVNKTLVPTIAVPLLSACHSIFIGSTGFCHELFQAEQWHDIFSNG